jgi:Squalene-hopene cyclase C-terminal domain
MNVTRALAEPFRFRLWRPLHMRLIMRDALVPQRQPEHPHRDHLAGAIDWLCRAQDVRDGRPDAGGVSAGWSFEDGWLPSYPETSGYIVETLLAAARTLSRAALIGRVQRIIDWELSIQHADGAFPGHFGEPGSRPVIFNTGQIMHGMLAGYLQSRRDECLVSAVRAGRWLVSQQDDDGCWRKFEHHDVAHTYNTRATWALLATGLVAGEPALKRAAVRNLDWAMTQQRDCGWFDNNAFTPDQQPFTHTIAYAIRGLLESGVLLDNERYVGAALKAARALAALQRADGWLAGEYAESWIPAARYCCLTGVAQMSLNWLRLAQVAGVTELRAHARSAIAYLKRAQYLEDADAAVRGGIPGSLPIWGRYSRFEFPNWAAKFFADALIMDLEDVSVPPVHAIAEDREGVAHV